MNALDQTLAAPGRSDATGGILKMAILAVGGQGGGVLSNWVADLARLGGHVAQVTSVAGVAQRTGATIYYVEMAPAGEGQPVFALSPTPGDVDILIASELMEAGRAVQRGFVTPDRTTLIASSHRILSVSEKQVPGDGRGAAAPVEAALAEHARALICFDMEKLALDNGTVISASLFGALARSCALPFDAELFEEVIRRSGKGVEASLAAFRATLHHAAEDGTAPLAARDTAVSGPDVLVAEWRRLEQRLATLPAALQPMARAGLRKTVDYQDVAYGADYLDRLDIVLRHDDAGRDHALSVSAAKAIANAMCYDDIIRVADLKTRANRAARLRREQQIEADELVRVTEYFHPRAEELTSILPAGIGRWADQSRAAQTVLRRIAGNGRRLRSDRLRGFAMLWLMAALRPARQRLLRHGAEMAHLDRLTETALRHAATNYDLGVELFNCQRLIKGYSDTHARGLSKFDRVLGGLDLIAGRDDAADSAAPAARSGLAGRKGYGSGRGAQDNCKLQPGNTGRKSGRTHPMTQLTVKAIEPITDRISLFTLVAADGAALPVYAPGAHIDLDLGDIGTRSYSLVDLEPQDGAPAAYRLAVQREDDGDGGSRCMHGLRMGDNVTATAPKDDFHLHQGSAPALLIAGGIGVTPILSFATALKARGTPFAFHYATRSAPLCAFRDRLEAAFGTDLTLWFDDQTMIDLDALLAGAAPGTQIYCCGPKGMIEAVREKAEAADIDKEHVHFELFSSPASHEGDKPFEVEINDGRVFTIPADKTIVEVLEEAGVDVMFDCQRGDCGICQTDVLSGEPDHRDVVLSEAERASGKVMQICVSRAKSARLVLDNLGRGSWANTPITRPPSPPWCSNTRSIATPISTGKSMSWR
ncbi:MAG: indolepyruvate oxidoreductase subunit beta family protein [Paracoccaceae bacterium]